MGFHLNAEMDEGFLISPFEPLGHITQYIEKEHPDIDVSFELVSSSPCLLQRRSQKSPQAEDTLSGLRYLHRRNMCHGDMKAVSNLYT